MICRFWNWNQLNYQIISRRTYQPQAQHQWSNIQYSPNHILSSITFSLTLIHCSLLLCTLFIKFIYWIAFAYMNKEKKQPKNQMKSQQFVKFQFICVQLKIYWTKYEIKRNIHIHFYRFLFFVLLSINSKYIWSYIKPIRMTCLSSHFVPNEHLLVNAFKNVEFQRMEIEIELVVSAVIVVAIFFSFLLYQTK